MAMIRFEDMGDMFGRVDRMMNRMMNNMFGTPDPFGFNQMMTPFGGLDLFPKYPMNMNMNMNMFTNPSSSYYCSSSVMSMTTDQHGRPQVYEQTSSTRSGPGGIRETRNTVRDSTTGLQKMSIGHHINERGHIVEKSRNHYTGEEEHNEEYVNLDEDEGQQFNEEWHRRVSHAFNHGRTLPQIRQSHCPQLALPSSSYQQEQQQEQEHNKNKRLKYLGRKKSKDKKSKPYNK